MPANNQFSAVNPALGYLYQVRASLLWSLQKIGSGDDFRVSLEILDDVAFESNSQSPSELLQTKHHSTRSALLTDSCTDLWKTLRVWIEGVAQDSALATSSLQLVTTGIAPNNSAAAKLKFVGRDTDGAKYALDAVARTSANQANAAAYRAYESLSSEERSKLLDRIFVVDAAPTITDLDGELRETIFWAVDRDHQNSFLDRLEGWWLRRVVQQLTSSSTTYIGSAEIESEMGDLRDQFRQDSLPIDGDLLDFVLDEQTSAAHQDYRFVKQLRIIEAGHRRIANAIHDFYRAYEQRSRWVREDLVVTTDISRYEKRLTEEWSIVFDAMCDEIGDAATDEQKKIAARSVLKWAESVSLPIRSGVTEPFLCRGSLHMLADNKQIGWHPDFQSLLSSAIDAARLA